jgi:hypothetical protein
MCTSLTYRSAVTGSSVEEVQVLERMPTCLSIVYENSQL